MPDPIAKEAAPLGQPKLVCRTCRPTLVWGFLVAGVPFGLGGAVLAFLINVRHRDWTRDVAGTVILLALAAAAFYAGWVLWRSTNRLRHVRVAAHDGGLTYQDWARSVTCTWDQVEDV